jgi:malate/lactate dehydrogenase
MAEACLKGREHLLSWPARLSGQCAVNCIYVDAPVISGADGVERNVKTELNDDKATFDPSVKAVTQVCHHTKYLQ